MIAKSNGNGNGNRLQKHYSLLTKRERLATLIAAVGRNDKEEMQALMRNAPRVTISRADHAGLFEAILHAASLHTMTQLDMASTLLLLSLAEKEESLDVSRLWAYTFQVRADGWGKVCAEFGIDPSIFHKVLNFPGEYTLQMTAEVAKTLGVKREEAEVTWKAMACEGGLPTAEGEAEKWRTAIRSYENDIEGRAL